MTLSKGLEALGIASSEYQIAKLNDFMAEIELWNPVFKLVATQSDLVKRHVLDSLAGLKILQMIKPKRIADIGSGAGFPGIPLSLWLEDTPISLIERSQRRAGFLRSVTATLNLSNVDVIEKTASQAQQDGPFDLLTFRAWSPINDQALDTLVPLLSCFGTIAAYKGRREQAELEISAVAHRLDDVQIHPLNVPELAEDRCMVLIRPSLTMGCSAS